jgi:hypothetical protein
MILFLNIVYVGISLFITNLRTVKDFQKNKISIKITEYFLKENLCKFSKLIWISIDKKCAELLRLSSNCEKTNF